MPKIRPNLPINIVVLDSAPTPSTCLQISITDDYFKKKLGFSDLLIIGVDSNACWNEFISYINILLIDLDIDIVNINTKVKAKKFVNFIGLFEEFVAN